MHTIVVETACGPVEYSDTGSGDAILYFHGTGVAGNSMVPIESPLIDDGFRLIVPNRPGYGRTPLSQHDSAADCADVAASLLDSLGMTAVNVMGSSGGAAFAASFAVNHPDRARTLVLLCPQIHRWDHKRWLPSTSRWTLPFLKRPLLCRLLLKGYRRQLRRMSVKQFLKTEAGNRYTDVVDDPEVESICKSSLAAMSLGVQCPGFENDFTVFVNEDVFGAEGSITVPTLVIHDRMDPMAPVVHVDWFLSKVPHCECVSIHAAGHLIWVGPDSIVMHQTRVQFLKQHAKHAE